MNDQTMDDLNAVLKAIDDEYPRQSNSFAEFFRTAALTEAPADVGAFSLMPIKKAVRKERVIRGLITPAVAKDILHSRDNAKAFLHMLGNEAIKGIDPTKAFYSANDKPITFERTPGQYLIPVEGGYEIRAYFTYSVVEE
jgi:hypothetical protein